MTQAANNSTKTEPQRDWQALYKEFLESGKSKSAFLRSKGIHPSHSATRGWGSKIWKAKVAIKAAMAEREADAPQQIGDLLGIVQTWSLGLAPKHYRAANMLRTHAEVYLENKLKIEEGEIVGTNLTPREMNALAQVLVHCQKMERLALGLSTENVAANHTGAPGTSAAQGAHVETPAEELPAAEKRGPVFVVEVNQNGKFVRPRPRMQLQVAASEPKRATA